MLISLSEFLTIYIMICAVKLTNSATINKELYQPSMEVPLMLESKSTSYFLEHEVSRKDAIEAMKRLNSSFFNAQPSPACRILKCPQKKSYCLGQNFLNDHCWCDQGHSKDGLPWVPHNCYVGDHYLPSVGSCFQYMDIKECCCDRYIANKYRYLAKSSRHQASFMNLLVPLLLPIFLIPFRY